MATKFDTTAGTTRKALNSNPNATSVGMQPINVRLSATLVGAAKALAEHAEITLTDLVREALQHHVSRLTLAKPMLQPTPAELEKKLILMHLLLTEADARGRLKDIKLELIDVKLDRFLAAAGI